MAKGRCGQNIRAQVLHTALTCAIFGAVLGLDQNVHAQNSEGVAVNLDVLDDLDSRALAPRLLMPTAPLTSGRIVLRPPPGVSAVTPGQSRVVLRPPPGIPNRAAGTPSITVPKPAPPAASPPTSVTSVAPSPSVTEPEPPPVATTAPTPPAPLAAEMSDPAPKVSASGVPITMGPAVESMPDPAPEPIIQPQADQVGSLPPEMTNAPITIAFSPEEKDLPLSAAASLASVTERMNSDGNLRVQLLGYASSADGSPSSVRRMSLSRALSVREFLMDAGIQSTRIEVRALGDQIESGEPNRVDVVLE